jgi:hypothetical protein
MRIAVALAALALVVFWFTLCRQRIVVGGDVGIVRA